jgi:trimeric autotransporter adhesin
MRLCFLFAITFGLLTLNLSESYAQTDKGISFQAVIRNPIGDLITKSGVTVVAKILSPNNCILREEEFNGVGISAGYLNLNIGQGSVGGADPGLSFSKVFDNSSTFNSLSCLHSDGSENQALSTYDPQIGTGLRKLRLSLTIDGVPVEADFNMRSVAFAVNAETLNGKTSSDFVKTTDSISDSAIMSLSYNKITSVPSPLQQIAGLSCADGKIVKKISGTWSCADESGIGAESDPTVQSFAKSVPGAGLEVISNQLNVKMVDIQSSATGNWSINITGNATTATTATTATSATTAGSATTFTGNLAGDVSGNQSATSVDKIKGVNIAAATASDDGKFLKFINGTGWTPNYVRLSELRNSTGTGSAFNVVSCSAAQTLVWSSITDQFSCQNISLSKNQISDFPTFSTVATSGSYTDLINKPSLNPVATSGDYNDLSNKPSVVLLTDPHLPSANCAAGSFNRWNGSAWVCEVDQNTGGGSSGGGWVNDGSTVVNSATLVSGTWYTLDLSSKVGTNKTFVMLQVVNPNTAHNFSVRPKGETAGVAYNNSSWYGGGASACTTSGTYTCFVTVQTNASGQIEYQDVQNVTLSIVLVGFISPSSAYAPTHWSLNSTDAYYNSGNVGIGTTSPAAKLDVAGEVKFGNSASTCNPSNEGQQRYNSSTKNMEFCNGTAWTGYGTVSPGSIVQTIVATSTTTASSAVTSFTEVNSSYRISFTPKYSNSKILIEYSFPMNAAMAGNTVFQFQLVRNIGGTESLIGVGPANGSRNLASAVARPGNGTDANDQQNIFLQGVDSGLTAGTVYTYGFKFRRETGGSGTGYFLYSSGDSAVYGFSGMMTMKITEIAQ